MDSSLNFVALQHTWLFFCGLSEVRSNVLFAVQSTTAEERFGSLDKGPKGTGDVW